MKNISILINVVLLVLVGILFWLHFSSQKPNDIKKPAMQTGNNTPSFKVAYFIMDSLDGGYEKVKDARKESALREENLNNDMDALGKKLKQQAADFDTRFKAGKITQAEFEAQLRQMDNTYTLQRRDGEQKLMEANTKKMGEIKKEVEDFLKEYNVNKGYTYIFAYDATSPFYYCDSTYDITREVLDGLNQRYKKKP